MGSGTHHDSTSPIGLLLALAANDLSAQSAQVERSSIEMGPLAELAGHRAGPGKSLLRRDAQSIAHCRLVTLPTEPAARIDRSLLQSKTRSLPAKSIWHLYTSAEVVRQFTHKRRFSHSLARTLPILNYIYAEVRLNREVPF